MLDLCSFTEAPSVTVRSNSITYPPFAHPPATDCLKGGYGISFWVLMLLGKFLYQRPLYRILTELRDNHGLDISPGTATGGMERLRPLFVPLYQEIVARNVSEERWHAKDHFGEEAKGILVVDRYSAYMEDRPERPLYRVERQAA